MNVVDSSGWLEYLSDGANADFFAPAVLDVENLVTPTICIYEVFKRVLLQMGEEKALETVGAISFGHIIELTHDIALEAARLSVELQLAMADSIILATARLHHATLWTKDAHFAGIESVKYIR